MDWMERYRERESDCCIWLGIRNQKKDCLNKKDKSKKSCQRLLDSNPDRKGPAAKIDFCGLNCYNTHTPDGMEDGR